MRTTVVAKLAGAIVRVRADVGFGDAAAGTGGRSEFPTLPPDLPRPRLRAYPVPVVVAERVHAIVVLGMANPRVKDYFDLDPLAGRFGFAGPDLAAAIAAPFARRRTETPTHVPVALTAAFGADPGKRAQWAPFCRRVGPVASGEMTLGAVVGRLAAFAVPPLLAAIKPALRQGLVIAGILGLTQSAHGVAINPTTASARARPNPSREWVRGERRSGSCSTARRQEADRSGSPNRRDDESSRADHDAPSGDARPDEITSAGARPVCGRFPVQPGGLEPPTFGSEAV